MLPPSLQKYYYLWLTWGTRAENHLYDDVAQEDLHI